MRVSFLPSTDPAENADTEERLFRERPFPEEPRLIFYTNSECVQCGRNQNYAFLLPRKDYDPEIILALVVEALHRIGVTDARFCKRFSVWHGEYKISGSAFALSGPAALLHGCLPFTTNLDNLRQFLTPECPHDPSGHSVASVVSPVANIAELVPEPADCRERFCTVLAELAETHFG